MKPSIEHHKALYVTYLALLAATPPLSTDMYLAALPEIASTWGVGKDLINLTLVLWFASFSVSILISGSLSDKYGRKPLLLWGLSLFVATSFLCAGASSAQMLILFRIFQGLGAGAPAAIVLAIIRDRFTGKERHQAIAYVMTIVAVAPMVAPIIGAMLLEFFNWRFIFVMQGVMVSITLLVTFTFKESLADPLNISLKRLMTRYTVHFRNKEFMFASISMGILVLPFYGFIAFSPIYYITIHGLSEKMFSLLFGLNALSSMCGAFSSSFIVKWVSDKTVITVSIYGCVIAGIGLIVLGSQHFLYFFAFMAFFSFCTGISRPISGNMILGLVKTDVGSASSFLVFYQFISGALCMAFVTLQWSYPVLVYGSLTTIVSILVLILWARIVPHLNPIH
ncbi:multidrug effflux MFS transporter [uncultured Desulfuromonas sp.]|uniref:multidrug effflux MFS transporter n=1 Tax=uncultured Desulfuromonas sp. TaxID=181013 RepID=UPI002AAB2371|nr:multidrug effflux MFS transporter [uncultured Desulfuromonas sp.]